MNNLSKRSYVIIAVFALTGLIFIVRLFGLQVLDPTYKQFATNNVLREVVRTLPGDWFTTGTGNYWFIINLPTTC